jgi:hypothetical protein
MRLGTTMTVCLKLRRNINSQNFAEGCFIFVLLAER